MILPERRFSFSSKNRRKQGFKRFTFLLVLILAAGGVYLTVKNRNTLKKIINKPTQNEIIMELWDNQKYSDLIEYCDNILEKDPSSFDALMFRGISSFYEGSSRVNLEERLPFIDDAVFFLRKAVLFDEKKMRPQIDYVLGKAYYHKGRYYCDLSVKYLEKSLLANHIGKDTYDYLGLSYMELGNREKSAEYFEIAAENNPSDILFLILAQVYIDLGKSEKAEEYLLRSNNKTTDPQIEEKNLFLLGQIYQDRNEMLKAENSYQRIIQKNPGSADAYYKLGLLYEIAGDKIKARAEWRNALRADPEHYGTRLKLF
ncbi:MAG: tetratricopeptide repeat protein [Spirochaetia bacterium]|jgi:tetratricopeptide (TPR) repeat protein|nr:tetratricopeptide repeat protein [Spirochaetia bacterium]